MNIFGLLLEFHLSAKMNKADDVTNISLQRSMLADNDNSLSDDDNCFYEDIDNNVARKNAEHHEKSLYIRACEKIGVVPCKCFRDQLSKSHVRIPSEVLGALDIKAIATALVRDYTIETLDLSNNEIGFMGASYLAEAMLENRSIQELNIAKTKPTPEGLKIITDMIVQSKMLKKVNISGNNFGGKQIKLLIKIMKTNDVLEELYAADNQIDDDGGMLMGRAIAFNRNLKVLDLSWNHIRGKGADAICDGLAKNSQLEVLDLSWNGYDRNGCAKMSQALAVNNTIRGLDLSDNRIDLIALQLLLPGLVNNTSLINLKIGKNPITTLGAIHIVKTLSLSDESNLRHVCIENVPVDQEFLDALEELQSIRPVFVRYGDFYRQDDITRRRKASLRNFNPVSILFEYMKQRSLRVIDMFRIFDVDNSQTITKDEFKQGLMTLNIPLTDEALDTLIRELDNNDDNEVDFVEMTVAKRRSMRQDIKNKGTGHGTTVYEPRRAMMETLQNIIKERINERKNSLPSHDNKKKSPVSSNNANT